jgi:hypothetical protein
MITSLATILLSSEAACAKDLVDPQPIMQETDLEDLDSLQTKAPIAWRWGLL